MIKDRILNNEECVVLFDITKELNLPIVFGTDSHGISLFSIYKGESISNVTKITFDGSTAPGDQKLTTLFIPNHFTSLEIIGLPKNRLI